MKYKTTLGSSLPIIIEVCFIISLAVTICATFINHRWNKFFSALLLLPFSFTPFALSHIAYKKGIYLSPIFKIVFLIFTIAALYLGPIYEFYKKFTWWDNVLHASSGIILAALCHSILKFLNDRKIIQTIESPLFNIITIIIFSIAVHMFWEVFEYISDIVLKTNMTNLDINDTMSDINMNLLGTIFASLIILDRESKVRQISD